VLIRVHTTYLYPWQGLGYSVQAWPARQLCILARAPHGRPDFASALWAARPCWWRSGYLTSTYCVNGHAASCLPTAPAVQGRCTACMHLNSSTVQIHNFVASFTALGRLPTRPEPLRAFSFTSRGTMLSDYPPARHPFSAL